LIKASIGLRTRFLWFASYGIPEKSFDPNWPDLLSLKALNVDKETDVKVTRLLFYLRTMTDTVTYLSMACKEGLLAHGRRERSRKLTILF
jgi:hypothetical protein